MLQKEGGRLAERTVVIDKLRLTYEGLFSVLELYNLINNWLEQKNYDKREIKNVEVIKPEGKYIELELLPWKKYTDYVKSEIRFRILMSEVKEVEVEKDGVKVKLNQGRIQFVFDGYLTTDYENRWENKPTFFFIRTVWDKFVYKPFTVGYQNMVRSDVKDIHTQIKSSLNLYRY